jgi:hypothetical protein
VCSALRLPAFGWSLCVIETKMHGIHGFKVLCTMFYKPRNFTERKQSPKYQDYLHHSGFKPDIFSMLIKVWVRNLDFLSAVIAVVCRLCLLIKRYGVRLVRRIYTDLWVFSDLLAATTSPFFHRTEDLK